MNEYINYYYEGQGADLDNIPMEEPSYGLCDKCGNNDGMGKCLKYKMLLRMCQRKKKCKKFTEAKFYQPYEIP